MVREKIVSWVGSVADDDSSEVRSRHLDELGIAGLEPALELLETVFRVGVEAAQALGAPWRFALVVALMPSEHVRLDRERNLASYLKRQSDMEPASVYLLDQVLCRPRQEEYRFPLDHQVPGLDTDHYQVFFYQRRPETEIDLDDVLYDAVCFEQLILDDDD